MLGDKGFIQDIRETFSEEVMTLSFDFKEESGHRWYLEKNGVEGKGGIQSSPAFQVACSQGFVIGVSMCINKANPENEFVTVGDKPGVVGREPNFVRSCKPLKDWDLVLSTKNNGKQRFRHEGDVHEGEGLSMEDWLGGAN